MSAHKAERSPLQVMFTSRDVARSIAFYRDVLGFELAESWPNEAEPMWASLLLDGQSVMIGAAMSSDGAGAACGADGEGLEWFKSMAEQFEASAPGAGVLTYLRVPGVDAFHAAVLSRGGQVAYPPKTQFYGIREFAIADPDGYRLMVYETVRMENCQSCGMPLQDDAPGQMYCLYCTDEDGQLKPYEQVFEGTVQGYFMDMQRMERPEAEEAARAMLADMPAWKPGHKGKDGN